MDQDTEDSNNLQKGMLDESRKVLQHCLCLSSFGMENHSKQLGEVVVQVQVVVQGPVVQKPIKANPRLKINREVYFSTSKCCSILIFGKTLHWKKSILKNKNKQKKLRQKVLNLKQKFTLILD